jgi:hypothetical protein
MSADNMSVPQLAVERANAFLESAKILCRWLIDHPSEASYDRGCVCLGNARHAIELFLKAALLKRGASDIGEHDINNLAAIYAKYYPEPQFSWNVPFRTQVLGVDSDAEREAMIAKHNRDFPQDQIFRYPMTKRGKPWKGIVAGFRPSSFLALLAQAENDFARLQREISQEGSP